MEPITTGRYLALPVALAWVLVAAMPFHAWGVDPLQEESGASQGFAPPQGLIPPSPVETPGLSEDFLALPAQDLEPAPGPSVAVRVGDTLTLSIRGLDAGAYKLEVPPAAGTGGAAVDLEEQGWALHGWTLSPVKPGSVTVPSLIVRDASGKAVARTNPFSLNVESAIAKDDPKPEEPADLAPPVSLAFPWWALVLLGVLALAALGVFVAYLVRWSQRRGRAKPAAPPEPPKPEHEIALLALADLEKQGLLLKGQFKKHYFTASEILKSYLGERYRIDALESTTRELLAMLEDRRNVPDEVKDELEQLFNDLDLVKFTDHVPASEQASQVVARARKIVQVTRRAPAPVVAPVSGPTGPGGSGKR